MKHNQTIVVQLVDPAGKQVRIPGVVVDLDFFLAGKFRYAFRVGPTDEQGKLSIPYHTLEDQRKWWSTVYLMDFNDALELCDSTVRLYIPQREKVLAGYRSMSEEYGNRAPQWVEAWSNPTNDRVTAGEGWVELVGETASVQMICHQVKT